MNELLRKAILAYDPTVSKQDRDIFTARILSAIPIEKLDEWAMAVARYPEYTANDLFHYGLDVNSNLFEMLDSTTKEWRLENAIATIPDNCSTHLFCECLKKGMDAEDISICCEAIPPSVYRSQIIELAWNIRQVIPDFDVRELAGMQFRPLTCLDYTQLSPQHVLPCMELLRTRECLLCMDNIPCYNSKCVALPQHMFGTSRTFKCTPEFHFCASCANGIHRNKLYKVRDDEIFIYNLQGGAFTADGEEYDFTSGVLASKWGNGITTLKLLIFIKNPQRYLWHSATQYLKIQTITFRYMQDVVYKRVPAVFHPPREPKIVIETNPLRVNGSRMGWYGVATRYYCNHAKHPSIRGPVDGRYLIYGRGEVEMGRHLLNPI